jgi:hypothetical protein
VFSRQPAGSARLSDAKKRRLAIETVLTLSYSADPQRVELVGAKLRDLGPGIVPALVRLIDHSNPDVRHVVHAHLLLWCDHALPLLFQTVKGRIPGPFGIITVAAPGDRLAAARLLGEMGDSTTEPLTKMLTGLLESKSRGVRECAVQALIASDKCPEARDVLRCAIKHEVTSLFLKRRKLWNRRGFDLFTYFSMFVAWQLLAGHFYVTSAWRSAIQLALQALMAMCIVKGAVELRKPGLEWLAGQNDPALIDIFAPTLDDPEKELRDLSASTLKRLLPKITAESFGALSDEAMAGLVQGLNSKDTALVVAILRALAHVGDERALSAVERLANLPPKGSRAEVGDAARAMLPILIERLEKSADARRLLRPVGADEETLLRPAGVAIANEELLLRTVNTEHAG